MKNILYPVGQFLALLFVVCVMFLPDFLSSKLAEDIYKNNASITLPVQVVSVSTKDSSFFYTVKSIDKNEKMILKTKTAKYKIGEIISEF